MDVESQIKKANDAIKHANTIRATSKKLLLKNKDMFNDFNSSTLQDLYMTMDKVVKETEKSMKGAKLAENRAKSRMMAVKKATAQTIRHTAKAKRAALASKKAAQAALITSKKMNEKSKNFTTYRKAYNIQVKVAISAAKTSESETEKALKASKTARIAARMPLDPVKI